MIALDELVNEIHGHGADHGPRDTAEEILYRFSAATVQLKEKAMLFNITRSFRSSHSPIQLYDVTRSAWVVNKAKADQAEFAFAIYAGVIREVYKITLWLPAGTTMTAIPDRSVPSPDRWEFVGTVAGDSLRERYKGKRVESVVFGQNPVRYVNFDQPGSIEED